MNKLEFPGSSERLAPDGLYLARGAGETSPCRPYLIGDVFDGVAIPNGAGGEKKRRVAILQHPCSMRKDGGQPEGFVTRGEGLPTSRADC
ncbi:hypothetical protein DW066_02590 [Bifidobacterium pseudocatenulatum]|nr:hypothetical protein DW066_02590 [Bifidobacterium pseudocatenulatum]